jgi:hypothetical protein
VPLTPGFPTSLGEYVTVWCADLLEPLTQDQRDDFLRGLAMGDEGGPWPSRLDIQRLVEHRCTPHAKATDMLGDLLERFADGIAATIGRLHDPAPGMREIAVTQLHQLPGTRELVDAVDAEFRSGTLTTGERDSILTAALSRPILPEPIPAPSMFPELPPDHPESWEEKNRRDPPYEDSPLSS